MDKISHITINVRDIGESLNWYKTSFKCEVIYQDKRNARLRFNNVDLILCLPNVERHHVAYEKQDAEKFGEILEKCDGRKSCYIADPTGNPVELVMSEKKGKNSHRVAEDTKEQE